MNASSQKESLNLANTLLMVDGSNFMFRAYHAMPDLKTSAGLFSGALFGMGQMLRNLRTDYPTPWAICVFDSKEKTFRHLLDESYKANRARMPEALAEQIPMLEQLVAALGWHVVKVDGIEADDVMGTLCQRATQLGIDCVIATGDKDMAQLVKPHIRLLNTMKNQLIDEAGVFEKFGVRPDQMIDFLSLTGDTSDNIQGVDKVGPKTAAKWLAEYGTLDELLKHVNEIKGVVGENLRAAQAWLPQTRRLVEIVCDAQLPFEGLEGLQWQGVDASNLEKICQAYELKTLWNWAKQQPGKTVEQADFHADFVDVGVDTKSPTPPAGQPMYESILTLTQLNQWMESLNQLAQDVNENALVALDTETDSLDPMKAKLVGLSFAYQDHQDADQAYRAAYVPVRLSPSQVGEDIPSHLSVDEVLGVMRPWLENPKAKKVMQHAKYDRHVLANHGVELAGLVHDTLLQSYVLDSSQSHGLEAIIGRELGLKTLSYEDVCGKGAKQISFDQVPLSLATQYAAEDADMTLRVHHVMWPRLQANPALLKVYQSIEIPLERVLWQMERTGVFVDAQALKQQSAELTERMKQLEDEAYGLAGHVFNLQSPKQVAGVLFDEMKISPVRKTASGTPSTDESVLSQLADDYPLPKLLLEHRMCAKLKGTYTEGLLEMINPITHRVHTRYAQAVVNTGRLSSQDPNLQNIPIKTAQGRRIRDAFVANFVANGDRNTGDEWQMVSADYSQIELRIMAHLSGDEGLKQAFINGEDVHKQTASDIFGVPLGEVSSEQRRYAKTINFGLIYGMSVFGLSKSLGIAREAAKLYMDRYFQRYPKVWYYMESTRKQAKENGFVETLCGRRLWISGLDSSHVPTRQAAERAAINAPMQGSAADLIKLAMLSVDEWLGQQKLKSRMLLQVHDELVLEVPASELDQIRAALPDLMTNVMKLDIPLEVEMGVATSWGKAH